MSEYSAPKVELTIEEHPNADRLELGIVGDYRIIVGKDEYQTGDTAVYIPDGSLLSDNFIARLPEVTRGYLAGSHKNRIKTQRIRGILSEGLLFSDSNDLFLKNAEVGTDCAEHLGVRKYLETIPQQFKGKARGNAPTLRYDIENFKKWPNIFKDGEDVIFTEKLHGTWCCLGYHVDAGVVVTSKGLSARNIALDTTDEENLNSNVYVKMWSKYGDKITEFSKSWNTTIYVLGEIVGPGIQKGFHYDMQELTFRMFDVHAYGKYLGYYHPARRELVHSGFTEVPILYEGPFSKEVMLECTDGMTTDYTGNVSPHMREGIVIKPVLERFAWRKEDGGSLGRIVLKSVSEKYLLRKGKQTEHE